MSKFIKIVGAIAGAVALVATGIGAFAAVGSKLAATAATVAKIATVVAGVANLGAVILNKPPPARGSVTQVLIAPDAPQPYVMGEGFFAGVMRHDTGYGATLNKVPNPYRFMAVVYSGGGPVQSLIPWIDMAAPSSWYSGFAWPTTRLGACPDTALVPQWAGAPGWTTSSKLSGYAAGGWSWLFDKDGKRFAAGIPLFGMYGQWVKVYDPRLDSTFPGGSGSCRALDETTYVWSENPALHAGTYALGRYQNGGKRTMGIGLDYSAIDFVAIAAWANTCELNGWKIFGPVYEPGDRFANLRDICLAGGCEPVLGAAQLGFYWATPRVAIDTITEADLAEGEQAVTPQSSWRARLNAIVPKYRSPAHNWEMVQAAAVVVSTLVTEDGELKQSEWPWNLVKDVDQVTELARYKIADARELQPIELTVGPRFRHYRPGDCLNIDLWDVMRLDVPAVILRKQIDPAGMTVSLTLISETAAKHGFALGLTGTPPPTPALGQTAEQRDLLAWEARSGRGIYRIVSNDIIPLSSDDDQIDIAAFEATLDDGRTIEFPTGSVTSLTSGVYYAVLWSLSASSYSVQPHPALTAMGDPDKVFVGWQATSSGGTYTPPDSTPPGYGGGGGNPGEFFPIP